LFDSNQLVSSECCYQQVLKEFQWLVIGLVSSESPQSSPVRLSAWCDHRPHVAWVNWRGETEASGRFSPGQGDVFIVWFDTCVLKHFMKMFYGHWRPTLSCGHTD